MTDVLRSRCPSAPDTSRTTCLPVADDDEIAAHHAVRRAVFVVEQALFPASDRDPRDDDRATVHVLGRVDGVVAGTVRIYPLDGAGLWKGDRLAVLPEYRRERVGGPLVRTAVATAGALGGTRMVAQVQAVNTRFFLALGWAPVGAPFDLLGLPHQQMTIDLSR